MPTLDDLYEKIDEIRTELNELEQMIGAYDSEEDEETSYRPRRHAENQPGWLAYLVAVR